MARPRYGEQAQEADGTWARGHRVVVDSTGLQRTPWPSRAPSLMLFACLYLGFLICAMRAAAGPTPEGPHGAEPALRGPGSARGPLHDLLSSAKGGDGGELQKHPEETGNEWVAQWSG